MASASHRRRLTYRRQDHYNIHVRGYKEEGIITTPLRHDGAERSRPFHHTIDATNCLPQTGEKDICMRPLRKNKLIEHKRYIDQYGEDLSAIRDRSWGASKAVTRA